MSRCCCRVLGLLRCREGTSCSPLPASTAMAAATVPCSDCHVREHVRKQLELPSRSSPAPDLAGRMERELACHQERRKNGAGEEEEEGQRGEIGIPQRWLEQAKMALRWDRLCPWFFLGRARPQFYRIFQAYSLCGISQFPHYTDSHPNTKKVGSSHPHPTPSSEQDITC
jgi:hypothetical protein